MKNPVANIGEIMFSNFIKVEAKSQVGDYSAIVNIDHIGSVLESAVGCQIVCKNGDIIPVKDDFADVEKKLKVASGGMGGTIMA